MPKALYFTDDPEACKLLAEDPFALLVGFAIDQQVPVQKAFAGPYVLQQRVGTLDPASWRSSTSRRRSGRSLRSTASRARWPTACASWPRWSPRTTAATPRASGARRPTRPTSQRRIGALPGFGKMKVMALGSVLAKQFGVKAADPLVPAHACLGEVDSPEALQRYQAAKREHKAKLRAGNAEH